VRLVFAGYKFINSSIKVIDIAADNK